MRNVALLVLLFSVLFFSCSDDGAKIASAESSLIFDYGKTPPDMRLSVFVNSETDLRLASGIKIESKSANLEWNCDDLVKFEDKASNAWAGCANITAALGMRIPLGEYVLTYSDMAGNEDEISFYVDYPENILNLKPEDFSDDGEFEKKIAVYAENGDLLYYGSVKKEWNSKDAVFDGYKDAGFVRICYASKNDSVICLMPPESLEQQ